MEDYKTKKIKEDVVNKIVQILNSEHALNWIKTWNSGTYINYVTKKYYQGINKALLSYHKISNNFKSNT